MSAPLLSSLWYRVADLKPALRPHIKIDRQDYRGEQWFVLEDQITGKHHRFNQLAYQLIGLMNGQQTMQAIWNTLLDQLGDDAPTQDETLQILGQLHAADIIQCATSADSEELLDRFKKQNKPIWKQWLKNPLAIRFPLYDPDPLLEKYAGYLKILFSGYGLLIWLLVISFALLLTINHWSELSTAMTDQVLTPFNLLLLWCLYPLIKLAHEAGHAIATKIWDGEVHETGIMMLVFIPNPYMDASAANTFKEKYKRVVVSAAGMMAELFIAAVALFLWLNVEAGLVKTLCYNTMLIASISTLLFNANPLLRFDGYYILSDLIGVANLATKSNKYIGYLIQNYLFGMKQVKSPVTSKGEQRWLAFYAISSFLYRLFILAVITLFVASEFFFIGVMIALWAILMQIILPLFNQAKYLFSDPALRIKRSRAISVTFAFIICLMTALLLIPIPSSTLAQGVIWLPEKAEIRTSVDGFVKKVLVSDQQFVRADQPLIQCHDPLLITKLEIQQAKLQALTIELAHEQQNERVQAEIIKDQIKSVSAELNRLREQQSGLIIRSQHEGYFHIEQAQNLTGTYLKKGELVGYVFSSEKLTAKVVVPQQDIGLVRENTKNLQVRFAGNMQQSFEAEIKNEFPAATDKLPAISLGNHHGGWLATEPDDPEGLTTIEKFFLFNIAVESQTEINRMGSRIYARFDHGKAPLASIWYRNIRQLFLSQFDV